MAPLADTCFSTPRHFSTLDEVLMVVRSLFLSSECMQRSRSVSALVQLANDGNWIGLRVEDGAVWTGGGNIWSEAANPLWLARISKQSLLHCHCSSSHSMHLPSVGLLCNASKYQNQNTLERALMHSCLASTMHLTLMHWGCSTRLLCDVSLNYKEWQKLN